MRILIAAPFLIILALFALSNPEPVKLALWPTDFGLEMPLSLAILAAMAIAFLLGGMVVWLNELGQRRRARRAEERVRLLESEVQELRVRLPVTSSLPRNAAS